MNVFSKFHKMASLLYFMRRKIYSKYICRRLGCRNSFFEVCVRYLGEDNRIKIGEDCRFGLKTVLFAHNQYNGIPVDGHIEIGNRCLFGDFINISSINYIKIGDNLLTGRWVTITDHAHGDTSLSQLNMPPNQRPLKSKGPVIIGKNVWIGDKATILPNVSIGDGAIIGANAVVTKDVPPFCIAVGNPATVKQPSSSQFINR